jgi:hypothetical protein
MEYWVKENGIVKKWNVGMTEERIDGRKENE